MAFRAVTRHRRGSMSLFARARHNPEAFEDVYVEYHEQVLRFFARQTLDPDVAFDLMAETFFQMFLALDSYRGECEEQGRAWMWTIARHQLYRWRERLTVERRYLGRLAEPLDDDEYRRVEELADLQRLVPALDGALAQLSEADREILRLRVVEHRSYGEIATRYGIREDAARARASRALRALAAIFERTGALESPEETIEELVT